MDVSLTFIVVNDGVDYPTVDDELFPRRLSRSAGDVMFAMAHGWNGKTVGRGEYMLGRRPRVVLVTVCALRGDGLDASHRRGLLPFTVSLVYESIPKLRPGESGMIRTGVLLLPAC